MLFFFRKEAIAAMQALWAHEAAAYHGAYDDLPPVRSFPRPVQHPHPPILRGGAAQLAARIAPHWGRATSDSPWCSKRTASSI